MVKMEQWLARKAEEKRRLYEQYGKALEKDHKGEYVAISPDGKTILGTRLGEVLRQAIDTFGSGNFALARVGHRTLARWLKIIPLRLSAFLPSQI